MPLARDGCAVRWIDREVRPFAIGEGMGRPAIIPRAQRHRCPGKYRPSMTRGGAKPRVNRSVRVKKAAFWGRVWGRNRQRLPATTKHFGTLRNLDKGAYAWTCRGPCRAQEPPEAAWGNAEALGSGVFLCRVCPAPFPAIPHLFRSTQRLPSRRARKSPVPSRRTRSPR